MFLPPFFLQDVANSSKEMFVEHFLLRKKWKSRFIDYILTVIMVGVVVLYGKYMPEMPLIAQLRESKYPNHQFQPRSGLWMWLFLTVFVCVTAEGMTILDSVLKKMKRRQHERWLLAQSITHARAA